MGKSWRNPLTGQVQVKRLGGFEDFCVADLWTRDLLHGTVEQLTGDPYLFRPIPMSMRTWIYHHLFREGHVIPGVSGVEEDAMIRYVLGMHCIDALSSVGGKWSPVLLHVPMILFLCVAADINATMVGVMLLSFTIFLHIMFNTPGLYRICRLVTLIPRFFYIYWLLNRNTIKSAKENASMMSTVGFFIALGFCAAEIIAGDFMAFLSYRLHCSYEVIKVLPNRIFICRRHGAAHSQDVVGHRDNPVNEKITGMGVWQSDFVLIADVKGLIVELRPMCKEDWQMIFIERTETEGGLIHRYIGLDVYSPGAATIDALTAANEEKRMMQEKNQKKQDWALSDI